jgi:hypothetical protein
MSKFLPVVLIVFACAGAAQMQAQSCDQPYRIGHFVQLDNEDLRLDRRRAISAKELKDWNRKQAQAQAACNAFVSEHPNRAVSKEFRYTIKGFVIVHERCDSFCGTFEDLMQLYEKDKK